MTAAGVDVIPLEQGETDYNTPAHVTRAAHDFASSERVLYTNVDGMPALKQAIADRYALDNGLAYDLDEVSVGAGASQVIFNAFAVTLSPGDEVIVPTPAWTVFGLAVRANRGKPVFVASSPERGFRISPSELDAAITDRTRWLIINSPSNPSGAMYGPEDLIALSQVLRAHPHVAILSDDLYEHQVYDDRPFVNIVNVAPDLKDRTLVVSGVSKSYAMTGWRIGWGAGPRELVTAMRTYQAPASSSPSTIGQIAAHAALTGPQDHLVHRRSSLQARRDAIVDGLGTVTGISCRTPQGAFYVYPQVGGLIGRTAPDGARLADDTAVAGYLLDAAHVAAVPGSAFGLSPHLRMSYAVSVERLEEACDRIRLAVEKLL